MESEDEDGTHRLAMALVAVKRELKANAAKLAEHQRKAVLTRTQTGVALNALNAARQGVLTRCADIKAVTQQLASLWNPQLNPQLLEKVRLSGVTHRSRSVCTSQHMTLVTCCVRAFGCGRLQLIKEVKKNVLLLEQQCLVVDAVDVSFAPSAAATADSKQSAASTSTSSSSSSASAASAVTNPRTQRKETIQNIQQWLKYLDELEKHLQHLQGFHTFLLTAAPPLPPIVSYAATNAPAASAAASPASSSSNRPHSRH